MTTRPKPRKPSLPLAAISWHAGGGVQMVREDLPPEKEDLEAAIVKKFVGALREHDGQSLTLLPRNDPDGWPDFEAMCDGRRIGIEVVEAILPDHARKRSRQVQYLKALLLRVTDLELDLRGLSLTIDDGYQDPEWPHVSSKKGQQLLRHLEEQLRADVPELQRVGRSGHRSWANDLGLTTGIIALRGKPIAGSLAPPIDLKFSGTFPTNRTLLAQCVAGKLAKQYTVYSDGDLWLLVYDEHGVVTESESVILARAILAASNHPFAAAWTFFPFPGQDGGLVAALYP